MNGTHELGQVATLYTWVGVGILLILLYKIAQFYQVTSGQCSHYRWFGVPLAFFAVAAFRYTWLADCAGDELGDLFLVLGGSSLLGLGYFLLNLMTGRRE